MSARIPLIHGGQVPLRQTGDYTARTPQLSAGDTGLGDAIGAVGKLAGSIAPKLAAMQKPDAGTGPVADGVSPQDVTALLEAESAMTAGSEKFAQFQKDNPDPELWSGGFDDVRKSIQEQMTALNPRLSPQGQKSLQSAYEGFEGRHIQTIGTQVLERRQEMAEQAVLGRTQQAVKAGDKPGFFAALRLALGAKILPQEKAAQVEAEGLQQFREADMKATGEKLTGFYKRGDFQGGRDLVTQMHARQELDEVQSGQLLGQVNYQEGRYTLGREMLKDPLTFREQTAKADARFKKLTGHDQQEMLNEAKKEISSRGYQEVLNAAAKIDSADLENIRLTKKVDKVTLQDLDAGELRYAKPHLRDSLDYYLKVRQGEASFDRPEIYQTARSWVKGYEPGLDKSGDVRRDMEAWIDLNFDREQAVNLKTDLQQQAENPYEGVPVQRAFRLVDELASGLPPVPGDQPGHGVRLLRQGMTNERAAYADHVKRMLDRKNGSGELKSEDEALSLVREAYTPEMRSLVHGGTARVPATLGDRLRNLPVQETGPDPRKPSAVYDPFETQRQNKTLPSATMSISPARAAQMAADQGGQAQDIARMVKKNWQDQTVWGRQHGGDRAWEGVIRLDNDTEAVMSALKDHARQQTVEQYLPDPGQRRRLAEQIQQGGFDPARVTPEFLPVMRALREVEKDPAFEFKPEHIYAGQMNVGERRLANYSLRRAEDGQMDVWLDLPDGRTFPARIPEVTDADFKTELERRKHAFAQAGVEYSEAQMQVSRHQKGGVHAEAVTQGRERAALSVAEQKMKQAEQDYEMLRHQGKNLLLGELLRTELQKPGWGDKVGQYGGFTEVYKGLLNASISAGTLAARVTGDEEKMRRFAEASEMLDLAYEGGSRRRFEGGLWNDTVSGLQRSTGEMLPYMAGGGLVRLGTSGLGRMGVQGATRELARQQAGRIGVGGMGMGAHATGSAYVDVTQRIRQAEADGDPERAQRLREGRDLFAVLNGATEVAVGRIGAIDAFQGVSRGIKGTSVELLKETVEEPLVGVIQRGVLEPGALGEHPDVAAPLAQEALSGLIMSGGMSGMDAGVSALAPRRSEAGDKPISPQESASASPGLPDVGAMAGDARFMPPGSTSGAEGSGSTTVLQNVPAGSQLNYDAEGRLTGATPPPAKADTTSPTPAENGNESESARLQFSQGSAAKSSSENKASDSSSKFPPAVQDSSSRSLPKEVQDKLDSTPPVTAVSPRPGQKAPQGTLPKQVNHPQLGPIKMPVTHVDTKTPKNTNPVTPNGKRGASNPQASAPSIQNSTRSAPTGSVSSAKANPVPDFSSDPQLQALQPHLPTLISQATIIDTRQHADGTTTHVLAHPVELDGKKQIVTFDVRRNADGGLELEGDSAKVKNRDDGKILGSKIKPNGAQQLLPPDTPHADELTSVAGTAAYPRVMWNPNPGGVTRTIQEAIQIAKEHGVEIPDYVEFRERPAILDRQHEYARYCDFNAATMKFVRWKDFLLNGKLLVRIDAAILKSDEGIVGIMAHEIYEITRLKVLFDENQSMPIKRLHELINSDDGHLHVRAWDTSDAKITEMRKNNYYGNGIRRF